MKQITATVEQLTHEEKARRKTASIRKSLLSLQSQIILLLQEIEG